MRRKTFDPLADMTRRGRQSYPLGGFRMAIDTARVLTIGEVAERLRISEVTIFRLMKRGKFAPTIKGIGRNLRWDTTILENWITRGER